MTANGEVPLDCAACGFFLGSGFPGGTAFCSRCQQTVVTKARAGNLGAAIGALFLVGLGIAVGALVIKALSDWAED